MSRTYVDNAYNRRHGRVGLPVGSAVISKNTVCGINTKTYVDNDYNRRLGRVGMSHGSAVMSKYDGLTKWHYLDTDRDRVVHPPNVKPEYHPQFEETNHTWKLLRDLDQIDSKPRNIPNAWRDFSGLVSKSHDTSKNRKALKSAEAMKEVDEAASRADIAQMEIERNMMHYLDTDRDRVVHPANVKPEYDPQLEETLKLLRDLEQTDTKPRNMPNAWREFDGLVSKSHDTSKNRTASKSADAMKQVDEAAFRADLVQMEIERNMMQRSQSDKQDARLKYTACIICYNDIENASVTPCGHHFCTHCIIQLLETKRKCPRCHRHVRESELIRDEEFDAIVNENKLEGKTAYRYKSDQERDDTTKMQDLRVEIQNTKSENKTLVQQIGMYARQCNQLKRELYDVKENVLVEQKELVKKLRGQLREQEEKMKSNVLSKNELDALKNLQTFYERQIRGRRIFTEDTSRKLNEYIEVVIDEVCARKDTGDDLLSVIRGFTSLIDENCQLHRNESALENQLRRVKRKLHLAKANTHKLEKKYLQERTSDED